VASDNEVKLEAELKKLIQQRVDIEKQIVEQKNKSEASEKKSIENIKQIISLDALRMDSIEKEQEVRKKIQDIEKESEDRNKKFEKSQQGTVKSLEDMTKSSEDLQKIQEQRESVANRIRGYGDDERKHAIDLGAQYTVLSDKAKKQADVLVKNLDVNNQLASGFDDIAKNIESGNLGSKNFLQTVIETRNVNDDITELYSNSISQTADIEKGTAKIVETDRAREAVARKRATIDSDKLGLNEQEKSQLLTQLALDEQRLDAIDEQNKVIEKQNAKMGMINDIGSKLGTSMSSWVTSLPSGDKIVKILGIDETAAKMNKSFTNAIQNGLQGNFKTAFAEGVKGLGSMIAMAPKLAAGMGLGLIVGGLKGMFNVIMEVDGVIAQMGKDFAMNKKEAGQLYQQTVKLSNELKITGINSKEIAEGIQVASEAFNGIDVASQIMSGNKEMEGFVKQAAVLSKQFGLSGGEIARIKDIATITGTSMDKLVKESVDMGKGVMNAKESMKVLAGIPKEVAVGFKGASKELVAAAQKAKLLGTDLKKIKDIGRGMLDLESSLTAEFEAQAITGKNMNLDAARRFAMEGNIFGLQEELLDKAGSLEDFTNMNVIQQEAFAKAMGMSVEEMADMLTNAEKLSNAGIDADYAEKLSNMQSAAELEKEMAGAKNQEQKDYIAQLAAEKRSASLKESMADAVEKLKQKFAPVIDAIVQMVSGLEQGSDNVSIFQKMLDGIDMDAVAAGIKEALPKVMTAVQGLIKNLPKIIEMITGLIGKFSAIADVAGGAFSFLGPTTAGLGVMALKVAGPGGIAAGFSLVGKGAMGLFGVIKGPLMDGVGKLAGSVTSGLGGAFGKVGEKAGALGSKIKDMAASKAGDMAGAGGGKKAKMPKAKAGKGGGGMMDGIADFVNKVDMKKMLMGAAAILVLAAALYVVAKALQEFMKVDWGSMAKAGVALLGLAAVAALMAQASVNMIIGAGAMLVLGAALYVIGAGLQFFTSISWEDLAKAGVALVAFSAIAAGLGFAAPFIIVGAAAMVALGAGAFAFGAGMNEIVRALVELQKLGDLDKVGENLGKGMESLGSISDKVDLSKLEDSFDDLDDALEELDFEQLAAFGQLGNSALKGAGDNLVAGINSLMGINKAIDWGGLEDTFEDLTSALEELDLDGITAFAKLGEEGIKKAGENLVAGLNSFQNIDLGMMTSTLDQLKPIFSKLRESFAELTGGFLQSNPLEKLAEMKLDSLPTFGKGISDFLTTMSNLKDVSGLDKLKDQFEVLADAIDELDIDKLNELAGIKPEAMGNLGKLQAVFQPAQAIEPQSAGAGGAGGAAGAGGASAGGGGNGGVEAKLDQLIGLFSSIANQPTVIKFGDKFVEEIRNTINIKKTYNVEDNFGRTA
jgi:DNA-directed RNA polymerase subunit H (RpoH/RPB5)